MCLRLFRRGGYTAIRMADSFPGSSETGGGTYPRGSTSRDDKPREESGEILFRRYRVRRELGRGGMGVVVLAHDTALDIPVAVKLVPDLVVKDEEAIADLRKEVLRGMALMHPGIVRTHNFERDEGGAGIVMEFVDGDTLSGLKARQPSGCFQPHQVLSWIEQLCSVLDYAHREARIVHRDLKPRNVMVTQAGKLKVADFGIAATLSDSVSRHSMEGMISGTLSYMSPQQAQGKRPTHLDDIHALGATIYELLTGKPPFFRGNPTAIHAQILTAVPPSMAERREEMEITGRGTIPTAWEKTVAACLAKEPSDRPQSAGEVFARLTGAAGSASAVEKSMPWVWMGTGAFAAVVLGGVALIATRENPASPAPVVAVVATPEPATPAPATPLPSTPLPATPAPTPVPATPVPATPAPTPIPSTPAPTPMPVPVIAPTPAPTVRPQPTPSTPRPSGTFVIVPPSTATMQNPTPPPGIPVFRPELSDEDFRRLYPQNPRAPAPGIWEHMQEQMRTSMQSTPQLMPTRSAKGNSTSGFPTQPIPTGYAPPVETPMPASAPTATRLTYYVQNIDQWLTALSVEPSMRPQSDLKELRDRLKADAAKAAKDDPVPAAALALGEALVAAIDAREGTLMKALQTQKGPSTQLGGNNRAFFMNIVSGDWDRGRPSYRNKVLQAATKLEQAQKATPAPVR